MQKPFFLHYAYELYPFFHNFISQIRELCRQTATVPLPLKKTHRHDKDIQYEQLPRLQLCGRTD